MFCGRGVRKANLGGRLAYANGAIGVQGFDETNNFIIAFSLENFGVIVHRFLRNFLTALLSADD